MQNISSILFSMIINIVLLIYALTKNIDAFSIIMLFFCEIVISMLFFLPRFLASQPPKSEMHHAISAFLFTCVFMLAVVMLLIKYKSSILTNFLQANTIILMLIVVMNILQAFFKSRLDVKTTFYYAFAKLVFLIAIGYYLPFLLLSAQLIAILLISVKLISDLSIAYFINK